MSEQPNHNPEDPNINQQFGAIVQQEQWSNEALILNAPTPLDINVSGVSDERFVQSDREAERNAFLPQLTATVEGVTPKSEYDPLGSIGMDTLNGMSSLAFNLLGEKGPQTSFNKPQVGQAMAILEAYPNPNDLVISYGAKLKVNEQECKKHNIPFDMQDELSAVEAIAATIYGERWTVYKDSMQTKADTKTTLNGTTTINVNPSYDQKIAAEAVSNYDATKAAEAQHIEALSDEKDLKRIQEIASMGLIQRIKHRKELRNLEKTHTEITEDANGRKQKSIVGSVASYPEGVLNQTVEAAREHVAENGAAYHDNAVIEANNDFINRRSTDRIMTPDALQQKAGEAQSFVAQEQQPPIVSMDKQPPRAA